MTQAIPQPRSLPLLGNFHHLDADAPVQSLMRLAKSHGPIFRLSSGPLSLTILSGQALVDEVCDETRFAKKLHRPLVALRDLGGDGLFTAYNDEPNWAKAHRLLMPAFGPIGVRSMFGRMEDIAEQMLQRWERFGPDAVIDVADNMTRLTLDTIALCAFDYRFNSFYQNEMHPFVAAMVGALAEAGSRARRPDLANRLLAPARRRYEADLALIRSVADTLIAERKADPDAASPDDLLNLMLYGRDQASGEPLSDENIRHQLVTFLIAGHETTSGLLSFALYLLLRNPAAMARAREAVDAALGTQPPQVQDLAKLRYIEQVLQETLRLWPTAPAFAVAARTPTTLAGRYAITPQDTLMVLIPGLHRDPGVWEEPEAFRPERFAPEAAERLPPNAWKPFGNGARACIGRGFAIQEAQLVLAMILQRFELEDVDPHYQLAIAETLTLKPDGFRIRARRRGDLALRRRSAVPSAPQKVLAPAAPPAPQGAAAGTALLVLYGGNSGSCEAFAQRIGADAVAQGYAPLVAPLDDYAARLPREGVVVVVTSSYEGQPPDNARRFLACIEALPAGALAGLRFTVFGSGNRQWARTYQAIPKRVDAALDAAGAVRFKARGETDAGGDFFGGFDAWYAELWPELGQALGKASTRQAAQALEVDIVPAARLGALRLAELDQGRVIENRELVDMSAPFARSKRHLEIALPDGMRYRTGDYLAVLPRNPAAQVERALRRFGLSSETQVVIGPRPGAASSLPSGYPVSLAEVLSDYVELAQPATRAQVAQLAAVTRCPPEREALDALAAEPAYGRDVLATKTSLLDLLERFPACDLSLGAFLGALPAMRARQYSISSSPLRDPARCSLTVAVLDAPALSGIGRRRGVASTYLAGLGEGAPVSVAVRPSQAGFHPPEDPATPIVLVCSGSGIAPFHGFLQERAIQKAGGREVGQALLFFGVDHPEVDYLYREELQRWQDMGVVDVRPAFSQAPEAGVVYVQHRVWEDRARVAALFRQGAVVFVCGDGEHMAPAVRDTFVRIYRESMGVSEAQANAWADRVEREHGRYVADIFS
ncbi:bifunctional cytochrome P450/NADPH--P450 reductase [Pseudoxanthomonas winnipegensis]|uniref:Bifunctional cytochrome P450/NADPH--P450 reductase n=1 Tax=Pseudoxanthomonas winnipegensis TaxID=2480810 RepID=A0A4Q8LE00_9GAMM|nr:cytochrome P450 [Pseudoxanthomonas winnipegensis]TAA26805.1 cytochrome P450 [Pseudoxanthomonas winnipegensis]